MNMYGYLLNKFNQINVIKKSGMLIPPEIDLTFEEKKMLNSYNQNNFIIKKFSKQIYSISKNIALKNNIISNFDIQQLIILDEYVSHYNTRNFIIQSIFTTGKEI